MIFTSLWGKLLSGKSPRRVAKKRAGVRRNRFSMEMLEPRIVLSAPDQWLQRGISGGGVLMSPAISPHNPNEIYVGTDMSQMFHSKDAGQSWDFYNFDEFVVSNNVNGVQFTSDPQVLFALDQNTLSAPTPLRSIDAGATWHRPGSLDFPSNWPTAEKAWRIFADPNSVGRVIAATQDEIYLSTNGGTTFTSAYTYTGTVNASQKLGLHVGGAFFDGSTIYVGTNAGLLISTNGGSFQASSVGGIPSTDGIFAFAGASNGTTTRLWAVTHTTSKISTPSHPSGSYSAFQNIYSLDVGQSNWTVKASGLPATAKLTQLTMATNDIDTVYAGGQATVNGVVGMYVGKFTTASGAWSNVFALQGATANVVTGFMGPGGHITSSVTIEGLSVAPNDSSRVMVTDGFVAHTSANGGGLWQQVTVPFAQDHAPGTTISDTEAYNNTGINNTTAWWIHFNSATSIYAAFDDLKWERSTDGGSTWSFGVNGLNQQFENYSLDVHPTSGRMYLSRGRFVAPQDVLGLSDATTNLGGGNISYSDDGGANWSILYDFGNPVSWTAIDPTDHKTMYASVIDPDPLVGGIYVSHNIDAGANVTFTRLAAQPSGNIGKAHTIEVLNDGTLVVVLTGRKFNHDANTSTAELHSAGSGVFRLDPGASQWTDVTHDNMRYWCKDLIVDPHDATQQTWYVAVDNAISPIEVVSGYVSNQPGLYMTTNRGMSWTRVFTPVAADSFAVDPNNPSEAYVTTNADGLWYTSNLRLADGVTINPNPTFTQVTSFPHLRPVRVFFNPYVAGEVWIASNGAGMLVGNASSPDRTFEFSAASFSVNENAGSATITVQRTGDTANVMSVDYRISDGTATNGSDYTSTNLATGITGTLTFLPGQSSVTVSLPIINDSQVEGNQTVLLALSGPIGGNFLGANANATLTIVDDDAVPTLSINDVSLSEANTTATFTVTLSAVSEQTVTVDFATVNGSATASADYTSQSGSLAFAPGETTKTITVPVLSDTLDEPDETFIVNLSNATNATVADSQGLGTITDDDAMPSLSISDVMPTEGDAGQSTATFTVILSAASGRTVTVDYGTTDDNATAGSDYTATSGSLTFAPGETTKSIAVPISGDTTDEDDERFTVDLSNAINAVMSDSEGLGTILDDDAAPSLTIGDVTVTEGNSGQTSATFTVSLSAASNKTVTLDFTTSDSSAHAPVDYSATSGSLTFAPGQTSKTISVFVTGDSIDESDETFNVNLSNAINALMSDSIGLGTILDDDTSPSLTIEDAAIKEGNGKTKQITFTVSLSSASSQTVTVDYATADGTAVADSDYAATSGTLTIPAGTISKTFTVPVIGDLLDEPKERFYVNLSNAIGVSIADGQAIGTIKDNDPPPALTINNVTVTEADSDSVTALFTVTLSAASGQNVTVKYATKNSSAFASADYISQSGTLSFAPGETTKTVAVSVSGDTLNEVDEMFQVILSNATAATISNNTGVATILDNDPLPALAINDVSVVEGQSGLMNVTFTVSLSAASGQKVSVKYATANGSAGSADYDSASGKLIFGTGTTAKTVTVSVKGDLLNELDETFFVNLFKAKNATIADAQGLAVITNDDP